MGGHGDIDIEDRVLQRVRQLSRRLTWNAEDAEDDVAEAVLRHLRTYDPDRSSPYTHLVFCLRKARQVRLGKSEAREEQIEETDEPHAAPFDLPIETRIWLEQSLPHLPPRQARAFLLHMAKTPLRTIGAELDVSHVTARKYVAQAKAALSALL